MTSSKPLIFYDLAGGPGQPFFSPATTRLRLAMWAKGIVFETRKISYGELRRDWCGLDKPLGVEDATAPFILRPDGTYLMDSLEIAPWLDEAYPGLPSVYLPTASLPLDVEAPEYVAAKEDADAFRKKLKWPGLFYIYGPRIIKAFTKEDQEYFTSDARMGEGFWKNEVLDSDYDDNVARLKAEMPNLEAHLASPDGFFFSATEPNFKDFHVMGMVRMIASTDPKALKTVFGEGVIGGWVERMNGRYEGMKEVLARDPVE